MKSLSSKFSVIKPRYSLLHAYWKYTRNKMAVAKELGNKAVKLAYSYGCTFDEEWAEACMLAWFGCKREVDVTDNTDMFILR